MMDNIKKTTYIMKKTIYLQINLIVIISLLALSSIHASVSIENLKVEFMQAPLGIDVKNPRFSWQMIATGPERNCFQTAYQLEVKDEKGKLVWDSKKVNNNQSLGITYLGLPLQPATRYNWKVTVWDQKGAALTSASWFETGLMSSDFSSWDGAIWIGGGNDDLVLYSHYLPLYDIKYTITISEGSTKAGFVLGANDSRLMDKNKNLFQSQKAQNESYIKFELDLAGLDVTRSSYARLNLYRVGYTDKDVASMPVKTYEIKPSVLNDGNKSKPHRFAIHAEYGAFSITIDDSSSFFIEDPNAKKNNSNPFLRNTTERFNLNPMGEGHDYITFGQLCDIGFSVDSRQEATFSDIEVANIRKPYSVLFREDLTRAGYNGIYQKYLGGNDGLVVKNGSFIVSGGSEGNFIVADPSHNAMPMLRTQFGTDNKKVAKARLYVTSRGIYEIYLNGKRVGDDYFNPGLTQYNKTQMYQTYDVTGFLVNGSNVIGAMLGEGWWSGLLSFGNIWNHFGDRQSLLAKLVITYDDGSVNTVVTNDKTWKYFNKSPVIYSSLDMGEVYDATREDAIQGWNTALYNDSSWKNAVSIQLEGTTFSGTSRDFTGQINDFEWDKLKLIGQVGNNAGVYKIITAQSVQEVRPGVFVYNMGQNLVGVPRISILKGIKGEKITLRFSEMLYPGQKASAGNVGMIMTENYRAALCQDIYIMKEGSQVIQPHFTSRGYQYIEITGIEKALPIEAVQGVVISSVRELTSNYTSSNNNVNKLWSNLVWSNIDNFLSIPTDCPQRNERMGWSGDISVFSRTATYVSNSDQFLARHMIAMRDVQGQNGRFTDIAPVGGGFGGVLWGSAGITVPWEAYLQFSDLKLLEDHYPAMMRYIDYLAGTINKETGISSDGALGDWLGPQNNQLGQAFLTTAYHIYDLGIMIKIAGLLNKKDDIEKFRQMYNERKEFFNRTFVNHDKKTVGLIGGGFGFGPVQKPEFKVADTQSSYAVGLALGAFSDENIPYMVKNLKETVERENKDDGGITHPKYSLMTGFIGTAWISKALSDCGYTGLAYKLLQNNQYPSWLYPIGQGATTIWERLNGYTIEEGFGGNNSMNSFNHYSFGAIGQWLLAYSLGIQRNEPGFSKFILQPEPDPTGEMTWAKGYYDSPYGRIMSSWNVDGGTLTYKAVVPANTTAELFLPCTSEKLVMEGKKLAIQSIGVTFIRFEKEKAVFELKSGSYEFTTPYK